MPKLVQMLTQQDAHAQELAAVVVSRLAHFRAETVASAGGIGPLVALLSTGTSAAQQHAASALADIAAIPAHRDVLAFEAAGVAPLVRLLGSTVVGTPEVAARALAHLSRDHAVCGDDGGMLAEGPDVGHADAELAEVANADDVADGSGRARGAARRRLVVQAGGVRRLISMLKVVPDKNLALRRWELIAKVVGVRSPPEEVEFGFDSGVTIAGGSVPVPGGAEVEPAAMTDEGVASLGGFVAGSAPADEVLGAREEAARTLADLAYGDVEMQQAILRAGGVPPLLRLVRDSSPVCQHLAARAVWHLCGTIDHQGTLVERGAVADLVGLSRAGSPAAQEVAAAVISELAKGAILLRERDGRPCVAAEDLAAAPVVAADGEPAAADDGEPAVAVHATVVAEVTAEVVSGVMRAAFAMASDSPADAPTGTDTPTLAAALPPPPLGAAPPAEAAASQTKLAAIVGAWQTLAGTQPAPPTERAVSPTTARPPADRLGAIAAAGGITPLVTLVTSGSATGKERAASALWHLSVDAANQQAIAKAGGIAPLAQMLDDGTALGCTYAADALAHLARNNPDNQAQIAKKVVGLLEVPSAATQRRAAHALWQLAEHNDGAPVRVVNAGGISPLVALLGSGTLEAKAEAVGALSCLARHDFASQLAIATGLVALLGTGSAEAQEHVTSMLIQLAQRPDNRTAIGAAGAIKRLIVQLRGGGETSIRAQSGAATVLLHLSGDSQENAAAIVSHGGLRPLVALLSSHAEEAQVEAARALADIARRSTDIQSRVVAEGGIEPLVRLLHAEASLTARTAAAEALWSLSIGNAETRTGVVAAGAIDELVKLIGANGAAVVVGADDATHAATEGMAEEACRQAAGALASIALGGVEIQTRIEAAGGLAPLVALLNPRFGSQTRAQAANTLSVLVRGHPANQTAVADAGGIAPLVALLAIGNAEPVMEEAASALWSITAAHNANQSAAASLGAIEPLVALIGDGSTRAQAQAAGALASMALEHEANQKGIAQMLVALLSAADAGTGCDEARCAKAARAISRLARAHASNQACIADAGGLTPLIRILTSAVARTMPALVCSARSTASVCSSSRSSGASGVGYAPPRIRLTVPVAVAPTPVAAAPTSAPPVPISTAPDRAVAVLMLPAAVPSAAPASTSCLLLTELAAALWAMAAGNNANQQVIARSGAVPQLVSLLDAPAEVSREAAGALWSLAALAANQRLIGVSGGIAPLVSLVSGRHAGAAETAAGALNCLAALPENRIAIADAHAVPALASLFDGGASAYAVEQASAAIVAIATGNAANQLAVASELVGKLRYGQTSTAAREHTTMLIERLAREADHRGPLARAGAIPELAGQLRYGTATAMGAAASALCQLALKSAQLRVQVTGQLITLLGAEACDVRQRASAALRDMAAVGGSEAQMTVAMAGGIDRFVGLLRNGSVEAQEYTLWLLQSTDLASKQSICTAGCTESVVRVIIGGQLSEVAKEHAAAVLAVLASAVPGVANEVREANTQTILSSGGIRPLVELLRLGTAGAKRHAAAALTQLACGAPMAGGDGSHGALIHMSTSMQNEMARAGAATAFGEWLLDSSLGPPELAAQALAHIAKHNKDTQVAASRHLTRSVFRPSRSVLLPLKTHSRASPRRDAQVLVAEEGAMGPLVGMLAAGQAAEAQAWAAAALAALAEENPANQIRIAEEGAIGPTIELLRAKAAAPHQSATRLLWHLASDADNQLAIAREGGLPPVVDMLVADDPGTREFAAAAVASLARECAENQVAFGRAAIIGRLVDLLGADSDSTQESVQTGLVYIACPSHENRTAVIRPLVALLDARQTAAQMKAAETLAVLAARAATNRNCIAAAGAIAPLVRLLDDGCNVNACQVCAAAVLADLA